MTTAQDIFAELERDERPALQGPRSNSLAGEIFAEIEQEERGNQLRAGGGIDEIVMTTGDGGQVFRSGEQLFFKSDGYSTNDQARIAEIMRNEKSGGPNPSEMVRSEENRRLISEVPLGAGAAKYLQGTPFIGEYMDEAASAISPRLGNNIRNVNNAMDEEYPLRSAGLRMAGAVAPSLLAPQMFVSQGGAPAQAMRGGLLAGSEAGVSGFGAGEDLDERAKRAVVDGALGFGFGSTLSGLISVFTKGTSNTKQITQAAGDIAKELGISREAALIVGQTLGSGGNLDDAVSNIRRAGSRGMLADADEAAAGLLDAVIASGGEAATIGRKAVGSRIAAESGDLKRTLNQTLGEPPVGMKTVAQAASDRNSALRGDLYRQAYDTPIDYTSEAGDAIEAVVKKIPTDEVDQAVKTANKYMQLEGLDGRQIKAVIDDAGNVTFSEQLNVVQLDYLKRGLQELAYGKYANAFGEPSGMGVSLNKVASELRDRVGDAVPVYREAVKAGGEPILERNAAKLGNELLNNRTTVETVKEAVDGASGTQLEALRVGARNQIEEIMSNARAYISNPQASADDIKEARALLGRVSSAAALKKLKLIMPEKEYGQLIQQITQARSAFGMGASVATNSKTASRMMMNDTINELTAPNVVGRLLRGEPVGATQDVVQALTGTTKQMDELQRQRILGEVARALTEKQGRTAEVALRYINEAMSGARLSQARMSIVNQALQGVAVPGASEAAFGTGELLRAN